MTNEEYLDILYRDVEYHERKIRESTTDLQKEFWTNQLNILLKGIEDFKKKTEGTH